MRYSSTHKQETRDRLLESSCAIAKKRGFGTTSVDTLALAVGRTAGTFFGHFASKNALFAELVEREMLNSSEMLAGLADAPPDQVSERLRKYLSNQHALNPEEGCALPTLGAEIARAEPPVRATTERALRSIHCHWTQRLDGDEDEAWSVLTRCVGALLIARAVWSEHTRQEVLESTFRSVEKSRQR